MEKEKSRIILFVQGGAGDVLSHTPMIRYFRKQYPEDEILVTSTYAQLLDSNPHIDKVVPLKDPKDFYNTYVHKQKVRFYKKHFVYDAIMDLPAINAKTLPEFICNVYNAEYDGGPLDYVESEYEQRSAKTFIDQYRRLNRPIVLLHCTGAIPSDGAFNKTNNLKDLNIEKVTRLVEKLKDKVIFIHIGLEGEPTVAGAIDALGMQMRETVSMIPLVDSYIFIESLFAHCSNALGAHGLVVFQNTDSKFFGYPNNYNLSYSGGCEEFPCNRPVGALLDLLPGFRNPKTRQPLLWECPKQVCAQMPLEEIEKSLMLSIEENKKRKVDARGNPALEEARRTPPPEEGKYSKPLESAPQGATVAGDANTVSDTPPDTVTANRG